jgi:hypothetical protein
LLAELAWPVEEEIFQQDTTPVTVHQSQQYEVQSLHVNHYKVKNQFGGKTKSPNNRTQIILYLIESITYQKKK